MELIDASYTLESTVTSAQTAVQAGSGNVNVFATPMMIAQMEGAAVECLRPFLQENQTSVGTAIATSHVAATPVGMKVFATAKVVATDGKKIDFVVSASDERGLIGEGTHSRVIVDHQRFEQKAAAR